MYVICLEIPRTGTPLILQALIVATIQVVTVSTNHEIEQEMDIAALSLSATANRVHPPLSHLSTQTRVWTCFHTVRHVILDSRYYTEIASPP